MKDNEYLVESLNTNMRMLVDASPELLSLACLVAVPRCMSRAYPDLPSRKEAFQKALDKEITELLTLVGKPDTTAKQVLSRSSGTGICIELVTGRMRHWRLAGAVPLASRISQFQAALKNDAVVPLSIDPNVSTWNETKILEYLAQSIPETASAWKPSAEYKRFLEVMRDPKGAVLSPGACLQEGIHSEDLENWYTDLRSVYGPSGSGCICKDPLIATMTRKQQRIDNLENEVDKLKWSLKEATEEFASIRNKLTNMPKAPKVTMWPQESEAVQ